MATIIPFQTTDEIVSQAKECYKKVNKCIGDSGDIKCFFCPKCVISLDERVYSLQMFNMQVYNSRTTIKNKSSPHDITQTLDDKPAFKPDPGMKRFSHGH